MNNTMKRITYKEARALITEELDITSNIEDQVKHAPGIVLVTLGTRVELCERSYNLRNLIVTIVDDFLYCTRYAEPRVFFVYTAPLVDSSDVHWNLHNDGIMSIVIPESEIRRPSI